MEKNNKYVCVRMKAHMCASTYVQNSDVQISNTCLYVSQKPLQQIISSITELPFRSGLEADTFDNVEIKNIRNWDIESESPEKKWNKN